MNIPFICFILITLFVILGIITNLIMGKILSKKNISCGVGSFFIDVRIPFIYARYKRELNEKLDLKFWLSICSIVGILMTLGFLFIYTTFL